MAVIDSDKTVDGAELILMKWFIILAYVLYSPILLDGNVGGSSIFLGLGRS